MKPEELRNTLSTQLDKAAAGEVITIVRGGLKFELKAKFPVNPLTLNQGVLYDTRSAVTDPVLQRQLDNLTIVQPGSPSSADPRKRVVDEV